jgi:hypothetical protein
MMTVSVPQFVERMERKWREYDNVLSDPLRTAWMQIAMAFNKQIEAPTLPRPVIPAELGAGKTTAAKMYCSMLPYEAHPGVLIVVRTIEQAEEYAREINKWAGFINLAFAFHSQLRPQPPSGCLLQFATLVICHRAYELALDDLIVEETERYDRVMAFGPGRRRLVIVDEALDQVYVARIPRKDLERMRRVPLPEKLQREHRLAIKVLDSINYTLLDAPSDTNHVISAEALLANARCSVEEADAAIVAFWIAVRGAKLDRDSLKLFKETLTAVRRHLALYRWTEGEKGRTALVGSRLLLPRDAGQVLLDATAAYNNVYLGRPEEYTLLRMPPVRDYGNVTLHVARASGTGKWAMAKRGAEIAQEALNAVLAHFGAQAAARRVLVVADLDSEEEVRSIWSKGGFAELAVAHWNKIDGRNDWQHFDTLVMLTLHHGLSSQDLATYIAVRGVELDDAGLNEPPADVRAMREARFVATAAQAKGRIRLRRMTRADGTCEPCEIFVRFPNFDGRVRTDVVIEGLRAVLKGLQVNESGLWTAALSTETTPAGRKPETHSRLGAKLLDLAGGLRLGDRIELTEKTLDGSNGARGRVLQEAQRADSILQRELEALGCLVEPGGYRKGVRGQAPPVLVQAGI